MDPLSISASIAGLVSLADIVFRTTTRYVKQVKESSREVQILLSELKDFSVLLHSLSLVAYDLETSASTQNTQSHNPNLKVKLIFNCQKVLNRIQASLEIAERDFNSPVGIKRIQARLRWPFSASETKELVQIIQHHKLTINLAINADTLEKLKVCMSTQERIGKQLDDIEAIVREISDIETKVALDHTTQQVLDFFARKIDNRSVFEMQKSRRHPLTCVWFTESQIFQEWQNTPGSQLWVSGIPGAGKSVIASVIIAECLQLTAFNHGAASRPIAIAYFFCSYRDAKTHSIINILSSLASHVARQDERAFQVLQGYYEDLRSHSHIPGSPSTKRLAEILVHMSSLFDQLYIIVDGLDECGDEADIVIQTLSRLSQDNDHITMALLSRDELYIREHLERKFVHMEVEAHTKDVELYVAAELEQRITSKKLRLRDVSLRDEIVLQLVKGARGMFRWVTCQIDHICELPTDGARRKALTKLPPTLFATYERILNKVETSNKQVRTIVQRSLLLIFHRVRLHLDQLCEAVSVPDDADTFEEDEVIDENDLRLYCSSLIRTSPDGRALEFAHYTVQEFLSEVCSTHATLNFYHVSDEKSQLLLGRLSLKYLTFTNHERFPDAASSEILYISTRNASRPFYEYAAINWRDCLINYLENNDVSKLLKILFDMKKSASFQAWSLELIRHCLIYKDNEDEESFMLYERADFGRSDEIACTTISSLLRPDFTTLHLAAALGLPKICQHLLEQGAGVDITSRYGTPLHCAIGGLSVFADVDLTPYYVSTVGDLRDNDPRARYHTVQILLGAGASVLSRFSSPFRQTSILGLSALASMYGEDLMVVGDLIKAGAEVEDEDMDHFQFRFDHAVKCFSHNKFKEEFSDGKAIISLLEALGTPEHQTNARFQLFELTSRFAQTMKLEVLEQASNHYLTISTNQDTIHAFLENTIEANDVHTLDKFIDSGNLDQVKSVRFPTRDDSWTLLHTAITSRAVNCLELLLKFGCPVDAKLSDGRTFAHLCWEDQDEDSLRVLIQYGISTIVQDNKSDTVWHLAADTNSTKILKLLLTLEEERQIALGLQSQNGRTPVHVSMDEGHKEAVLILMQHCPSPDFWKGGTHLFREAAKIGSAEVVRKLLDVGVELDPITANSESPLHFIGSNASVECARLLVEAFPHCHLRTKDDGKIPVESFMTRAVYTKGPVNHGIFNILANVDLSSLEYGPHLWETMCSVIVLGLSGKNATYKWKETCVYMIDKGALLAYEKSTKSTALIPLALEINLVVKSHGFEEMRRPYGLPGLPALQIPQSPFAPIEWRILSDIIFHIEMVTSCWNGATNDASLTQLLCQAVLQNDSNLIHCFLKHGVNPELRIDSAMSALDLACSPEVEITESNLCQLLAEYKSPKPVELGKKIDTLGLLYLPDDETSWKLRQLLEAGLSCNHRPNGFASLPLHWSIRENSNQCSELLLDFGANPWETDMYNFDAVFRAIERGNASILSKIATISAEKNFATNWNHKLDTNWNRKLESVLSTGALLGGSALLGGNALHLAASYGYIECLQFYLDRGLLDNIEATDNAMETPMHYAARFGQAAVVEFLKDRGGKINATSHGGVCPLHLAVQGRHLQTVRILIELGAEQKPCDLGLTPLAYACRTRDMAIIQLLKTNHENDSVGQNMTHPKALRLMANALEFALYRNNIQACKDLVGQGCPVDLQLDKPWPVTPLMYVLCASKSPEIAGWLIDNGARVSTIFRGRRMPDYLTSLEVAAANPMYNHLIPKLVAKYFKEKGDLLSLPRGPLHSAAFKNNHDGLLALFDAIRKETNLPLARKTTTHQDEISSFITKLVDRPDTARYNCTALHWAAIYDADDCARILLNMSANIHSTTTEAATPLHYAAFRGSLKVAKVLVENGVDLFALDQSRSSPVMLACHEGHFDMVKFLSSLDHNLPKHVNISKSNLAMVTVIAKGNTYERTQIWDLILAQGVNPYQKNSFGHAAIHYAMAHASRTYLYLLLRRPIDFVEIQNVNWDAESFYGTLEWQPRLKLSNMLINIVKSYRLVYRCLGSRFTPVCSKSVTMGANSLFYQVASLGVIEALDNFLAIGISLEWECCDQGTALMIASANGRLDAVKYLVRKGAQLQYHTKDGIGRSAISAAHAHQEIVEWLLIGRFLDQGKLSASATRDGDLIRAWSGVSSIPVEIKWEWRQMRDESLWEYARRSQMIKKELLLNS
ncbi:ankyrin repeat-containing domain protein [Xylaria telfairii]|nr:ankyrin repeat-containing domain protein [Xylaria telfairii]